MVRHLFSKLITSRSSFIIRWAFNFLPIFKKKNGSPTSHIYPLIDLFAAIIQSEGYLGERERDSALDFLRYTFPEVDHRLLATRFNKAEHSTLALKEKALIAGAGRSLEERMAMAMEIYSMIIGKGEMEGINKLFLPIAQGLLVPNATIQLPTLFEDPTTIPPTPITSVLFGAHEQAEVNLSHNNENITFRALRCGELLLIINDGKAPLIVRGQSVPYKASLPLSQGQRVMLNKTSISYSDIIFFLNAKTTGRDENYYVYLQDDSLAVQKARSRNCLFRISFGLNVTLEILKKNTTVQLNGEKLPVNTPTRAFYGDNLVINGIGPFIINSLKRRSEDIGTQYKVDPGQRTVRVSNDPSRLSKGGLLITKGTSDLIVFNVNFSHATKTGLLTPIENKSPIWVNNNLVKGPTPLQDGDLIRISFNQSLRCRFEAGVLDEERNVVQKLEVENLSHIYPNNVKVLDNINFTVQRGEMVCILGPSGSGKSTLLSCLAGHLKPSHGSIKYNNMHLYSWKETLCNLIAHIPREDVLKPYQTVQEHLLQATTIRRPILSRNERKRRVYYLLKYLGLSHLADRRVGNSFDKQLSDGERTRLNLGLDMSGIADVFLLDEPISGLSSRDSEMVIDTLINLSRDKIVIATLHRPNSYLLNKFEKVLLLDHGGQIAYWGTPKNMYEYFKQAAHELNIPVSHENTMAGGADYVFEVMEAPQLWHDRDRMHNNLWQARFENYTYSSLTDTLGPMTTPDESRHIPNRDKRTFIQYARLFKVWMLRTYTARTRSKINFYTTLLEGPILALLIALPLRSSETTPYNFETALHMGPYLFLSAVVAMFFGLMGSATEIIRDKQLLNRERNATNFYGGYICAKIFILTLINTIQCTLYLWVGNAILDVHELFFPFLLTLVLTSIVGTGLAFLISLLLNSERAALNAIPLLLIPQILLAGALIPFEEMNSIISVEPRNDAATGKLKPGRIPYIAELCPLRYAYENLVVIQATKNPYDAHRKLLQKAVDTIKKKPGRLPKKELRHLRLLLQALTTISSLEAQTPQNAEYALRRITQFALQNNADAYLNFLDKFQESQKTTQTHLAPISSYFVNKRMVGLFDFAESRRLDRTLKYRPNIFLSAVQPIPFTENITDKNDPSYSADTNTIPTPKRNEFYLALMGLIIFYISKKLLKYKIEK